ncbi:unnamed protein product [Diabrotica balteata]|uniref:Facilitated trehalose transporter Tret1-like n=1 Tax=Diabrotica balteata TaxID=107213 RepID=A0A9N9XA48_DIABA|nr:unnamed protein product [Diabrotica balteata]
MFLKFNIFGKDYAQIAAIAIGCLSSAISGMTIAWSSPYVVKITHDKENYNITEEEASYFTMINVIGLVVSLPFTSLLPDRFGRKPVLMLTALPYSICWLLKLFFTNIYVLYLARFCAGLGDGLLFASLPLYIGEISTPEVRGVWGNGLMIFGFLGQFLINVFGIFLTVPQTSIVSLSVPLIFVSAFYFMPESPYFFAMKDRDEEAKAALRFFRLRDDIDDEYTILKDDVKRQISESGTWKDLILIKSNRKAVLIGIFIRVSLVLSGIMVFITYTQFIFTKAGGNIDPSVATLIYTGVAFVLYTIASVFSEKLGRKKAFAISLALTSIILLLEGTYFYIDEHCPTVDLSNFKWFPLVGMLIFLVFVAFGVGILPGLMLSELFSASIKAKAISVVMMIYAIMYILTNKYFYNLTRLTGLCGPFFVFGCCDMITALLSCFIVPETKGKTLEEIQQSLKRN